ncbi:aspartyl protease family protein [Sagittula marina]|uniref:Aspartyl protease family protein n=1 Tax=Sagittula marina TaxID=943940 RepID=A0A7W6DRY7_9RHOB|nr:TIGR02281 family clan AA aspartic protease [Sagittula marina]MBB3985575.1 aspartyl protease family protein [Sagittula marina]
MSNDQLAQALFLGLLAASGLGWVYMAFRQSPGRFTQNLIAWALLFIGAIAAAGLWQDVQGSLNERQALVTEDGHVEIPRGYDGHYYVTLELNGQPVRFVVDTGASGIVLSREAAASAGLSAETLEFYDIARTANGVVETAPVTLDTVGLGPFLDHRVRAYVNGAEMSTSLLGMDYLDRFDRLEISRGRMILER